MWFLRCCCFGLGWRLRLFNYRIRVDRDGITVLLPYGGSLAYGRDELNVSVTRRIMRLGPVGGAKLGWRRRFIPQRWVNAYLVLKRKEIYTIELGEQS